MNAQLENSISRIAEEARGRFLTLIDNARRSTEQAAGAVKKGKAPLKTVSKFGLKLTAVTHRTTDKVLKKQVKLVEDQIDAVAGNLSAAAAATDLRNLVGTQLSRVRDNVASIVGDAQDTLQIYVGAGKEVRGIFADTVAELRGVARPVKAAKTTAKKTARKTPAKKAAAPKKAASGAVTPKAA